MVWGLRTIHSKICCSIEPSIDGRWGDSCVQRVSSERRNRVGRITGTLPRSRRGRSIRRGGLRRLLRHAAFIPSCLTSCIEIRLPKILARPEPNPDNAIVIHGTETREEVLRFRP